MLSRTQAGPGRTGKQEQEQISPNHVQNIYGSSVQYLRGISAAEKCCVCPTPHSKRNIWLQPSPEIQLGYCTICTYSLKANLIPQSEFMGSQPSELRTKPEGPVLRWENFPASSQLELIEFPAAKQTRFHSIPSAVLARSPNKLTFPSLPHISCNFAAESPCFRDAPLPRAVSENLPRLGG